MANRCGKPIASRWCGSRSLVAELRQKVDPSSPSSERDASNLARAEPNRAETNKRTRAKCIVPHRTATHRPAASDVA